MTHTVRRTLLAAAVAALTLAGCSDPPESGYVTHKQHSDAYEYWTTVCVAYNQYGCTTYVPILNHMPASWQLCLENEDDPDHVMSGCREVPPEVYARYGVGQHYPDAR